MAVILVTQKLILFLVNIDRLWTVFALVPGGRRVLPVTVMTVAGISRACVTVYAQRSSAIVYS